VRQGLIKALIKPDSMILVLPPNDGLGFVSSCFVNVIGPWFSKFLQYTTLRTLCSVYSHVFAMAR